MIVKFPITRSFVDIDMHQNQKRQITYADPDSDLFIQHNKDVYNQNSKRVAWITTVELNQI